VPFARLLSTAGAALADQGFYAGSHFLVNVLLARWMTKAEYGGLAIAFTLYSLLISFQSAIIVEPLYILGGSLYAAFERAYLRQVLYIEAVFSLLAGVSLGVAASLVKERVVANPLYALSIGSVFMLWFSLVRAECYLSRAASKAAGLSGIYFASNVALILVLHSSGRLTGATALFAISAVSAFLVILRRCLRPGGVTGAGAGKIELKEVVREHWSLGKWLVSSSFLNLGINFFPLWFTAYFLGIEAAGSFRAIIMLVLPLGHGMTAASNVLLPRLSQKWAVDREGFERTVRRGSWAILLVSILFFCMCALYRNQVEWALYGPRYRSLAGLIPMIAALPAVQAIGVLYSVALRAMRCARDQLVSTAAQSVAGTAVAFTLIPRFGIYGTTLTCLLTFSLGAILTPALYHWRLKKVKRTEADSLQWPAPLT
jgi:O-antigen/teichoic acid export membrane protein